MRVAHKSYTNPGSFLIHDFDSFGYSVNKRVVKDRSDGVGTYDVYIIQGKEYASQQWSTLFETLEEAEAKRLFDLIVNHFDHTEVFRIETPEYKFSYKEPKL